MGDLLAAYRKERRDGWDLRVDGSRIGGEWWRELRERIADAGDVVAASRHARTMLVDLPVSGGDGRCFLKVYHRTGRWADLKDSLRESKAIRALRMSVALERDGFHVPPVLAAGECRRGCVVQSAFLLTAAVNAPTLRSLPEEADALPEEERREQKRALLAGLGTEVGRLHHMRYVPGDLLVTNVLVDVMPPATFYFLDHDRSRRASSFEGERPYRRNLVQLNRIAVPGVTNADRYRFFAAYAVARGWSGERLQSAARFLARSTSRRREFLAQRATLPGGR